MQRRVILQGRFWPIRWQRSADCHSAAGFHQLCHVSAYTGERFERSGGKEIDLRIDDEDSVGFGQIERHTTRFQRDEEHFDIDILHEIVDALLTLTWAHTTV